MRDQQKFRFVLHPTYQCFRLLDMFVSEEKLTVQVGEIDGIQVDDMNFSETAENEIFEKFASDASSAHHEHASLRKTVSLSNTTSFA
jgi:hypothetical protein